MQEPEPLGPTFKGKNIEARRVAAWPGETGNKTELHRVFADAEHDRDRRSRSFSRKRSKGVGRCYDDSHATTHEVGHERWQAIELALQPMVLHRHVLTLDVARFVEALAERAKTRRVGRSGTDQSDHRHRGLLRAHSERPCER
jgi:hypothetical protein